MFSRRGAFIVSCLLVGLCYVNSLPNDFVFDDAPIVSSNPAIRAISPIQFLKSPYWSQKQYAGIYRPFVIFSLSIDYAMWKRWAPGFRFINLALHAINGFLVFLLCESLVGPGIVAFVAMIAYVVHPVHTEAVTTIVGRSELLAACFVLAAWLLFRNGRSVWACAIFLLALLSKENAIVLPAILALDMWLFPSPSGTRSARPIGGSLKGGQGEGRSSVTEWLRIVPMVFISLAYLTLRFRVLGGLGIPVSAQYMGGHLGYIERLLTAGRVFIRYVGIVFYPLNLAGDYDFNAIPIASFTDWDAWAGLLLAGIIIVAAIYCYRRSKRALCFGLGFALIAFIPSSNWILPISVLMAERFLYLPLVGVTVVAAILFSEIKDKRLQWLLGTGSLVTAIVVCNSHDYIRRNDFTFFKNMVRVVPDSAKARLGYGFALIKAGRTDEAARELEAGLRIIPDYPELLATLALTKMTPADCVNAWPLLKQALQIDPNHADTHRRMGDCYFKEGRMPEAESMYRQAAESIPNADAMLYFMWGQSLENTGQSGKAIAAYGRAALIEPDNLFFQRKLSAMSAKQSDPQAYR